MRIGMGRALLVAALGLAVAGCSTSNNLSDLFKSDRAGSDAMASAPPAADVTGSLPSQRGADTANDVTLGKAQYRASNFASAEAHFRHATKMRPGDAEAWLGLAAACDRLHRFDCADRAYAKAISIAGATAEILNNQGYSYMLRGDTKRAHEKLMTARRRDPSNQYVQNNLLLLQASVRKGKAIE
jgi:Flp pilus assembly protein TadD